MLAKWTNVPEQLDGYLQAARQILTMSTSDLPEVPDKDKLKTDTSTVKQISNCMRSYVSLHPVKSDVLEELAGTSAKTRCSQFILTFAMTLKQFSEDWLAGDDLKLTEALEKTK